MPAARHGGFPDKICVQELKLWEQELSLHAEFIVEDEKNHCYNTGGKGRKIIRTLPLE